MSLLCEGTLVRMYGEDDVYSNRDDLILDVLFGFKPMERLEYWRDVKKYLGLRVMALTSPF